MNPLKRIAVTLNASLEQFVDQIENHEALTESALREIQKASGQARMQYRRIQIDLEKMRSRVIELEGDKKRWTERARKAVGSGNQVDAIECARRVTVSERESARLVLQIAQQEQSERQLRQDLNRIEERVSELKTKRNQLAGRQAQADAMRALNQVDAGSISEIDTIFDRWESRLAQHGQPGVSAPTDSLEAKFSEEEQSEELQAKLAEILKSE